MARRIKIGDKTRVPAMKRRLRDMNGTRIKVGVLDDPELAVIAAANELGTNKAGAKRNVTIPERSFIRVTADSKKEVAKAFENASDVIDLEKPALKPLDVIGVQLAESVREKIRSSIPPPNKPSTIAAKGSSRTLIDVGTLVGEIKHEVV